VRRTVPPSAEIQAEIDKVLSKGMVDDPQKMLSELGRLGARLIIQRAVEDEFDTWLGGARMSAGRSGSAACATTTRGCAMGSVRGTCRPGRVSCESRSRKRGERSRRSCQSCFRSGTASGCCGPTAEGAGDRWRSCAGCRCVMSSRGASPQFRWQSATGADHQARLAPAALGAGRGRAKGSHRRRPVARAIRADRQTPRRQGRSRRDRPPDPHAQLLRLARRRDPPPETSRPGEPHESLGHPMTGSAAALDYAPGAGPIRERSGELVAMSGLPH
jgi:hypothetical protein